MDASDLCHVRMNVVDAMVFAIVVAMVFAIVVAMVFAIVVAMAKDSYMMHLLFTLLELLSATIDPR